MADREEQALPGGGLDQDWIVQGTFHPVLLLAGGAMFAPQAATIGVVVTFVLAGRELFSSVDDLPTWPVSWVLRAPVQNPVMDEGWTRFNRQHAGSLLVVPPQATVYVRGNRRQSQSARSNCRRPKLCCWPRHWRIRTLLNIRPELIVTCDDLDVAVRRGIAVRHSEDARNELNS